MRILNNLLSFIVIFTALTFIACEDEPVDASLIGTPTTNPTNGGGSGSGGGGETIVGTYKLTAYNSSVPTDLNNDGTESTNQLSETSCFNNMFLILNANNTFNADSKGIDIDMTGTTTECFTDPDYNGTWQLNGNVLTLTYVDSGVTYNDNFLVGGSGNSLSFSISDGDVIGMVAGEPVYLTSDIQLIYTKQ